MTDLETMRTFLLMLKGTTLITGANSAALAFTAAKELKAEGHAINYDETFDHEKNFIDAHVCHFISCIKCKTKLENL